MASKLVAIRHAKPFSEGFADEKLRPLSDEGKAIQRIMAERLKKEGISPTRIIASPLLRAQETAEVLADFFAISFGTENGLGYEFNEEVLLEKVPSCDQEETVFFVGHEPTLANFVNRLVGKIVLPQGLSKSGAAVVEIGGEVAFGKGTFLNYYRP